MPILPPKSNEELRGLTKCILLKGLPIKIKHAHFKKSLPLKPKGVALSKKSGQRNALITYHSAEQCSQAFDALRSFIYEGHETSSAFVLPRTAVVKTILPQLDSTNFCLDITNIPFFTTLEELQNLFPRAETIVMRCRKDGSFKGSCIAVFKSQNDYDEAEAVCKEQTLGGRKLSCGLATPEEYAKLREAYNSEKTKGNKEGFQIKLFNIPYSAIEEAIKKLFPRTRHIFLPKKKDGSPSGIAILTFKTKVICQAELARAQKVKLEGRRLHAEINVSVPKAGKKAPSTKKKFKSNKALSKKRHLSSEQSQHAKKAKLNLFKDNDDENGF